MGSARKKSVQKHQPTKAVGSGSGTGTAPSLPSSVQAEFLFIRADSPNLLANHIDNVQTAKYSTVDGQLELGCHLLVLFGDAPIAGFRLIRSKAGLDTSELGALETTAINSPGLASLHPSLAWAANSRFVVNTTVAAAGLVPGDLLTIAAQVGDQLRPVSRIYITGAAVSATEVAAA